MPRLTASLVWPFLDREIRRLTFAQQLRRRLEILGPTYIKLGQVLAIREDLLPRTVTQELENLFDRLPAIPFDHVREIIEESLERPIAASFRSFNEEPLGSASIAQAHLAETLEGEQVVVKVIKPGVREVIESDLTLLKMVGVFLQWVIPRYQPRMVVQEFSAYTIKEVDYTFEADHAETFAANFRDLPDVVFPRIHRHLSSVDVLTMEFMDGFKPGSKATATLSDEERRRLVDLGAASIIRMLYRDGFFHADLHAGNLMILPGDRIRLGFIDLGMVGRFEDRTRRQMLYYFHALVSGDVEGATRYLTDMATVMRGGDPLGFRRAVADLLRRFTIHGASGDISIAQLILASVGLGGRYGVFFPVEMTLMVKALVTFEGVGRTLDPGMDVTAVSQRHVARIFHQQFNPRLLLKQVLRGSPELVDIALRSPQLLSSGIKFAEEALNNRTGQNPLAGLRSSILAAACVVGGVIAVVQGGNLLMAGLLFALAAILSLFGK
jgi:ubiquinone biosynthesis protein